MRKDVYFLEGKKIFLIPAFVLYSASLRRITFIGGANIEL
jgi:hypothetical protein